jgi:hypothetical protein
MACLPVPERRMTPRQLLDGLRDGNDHTGGIRCLRLFRVDPSYFEHLRAEAARLCECERPSNVSAPDHVTNWTRPRGEVLQFSLFNRSGRTSDFSEDHDLSSVGKRFGSAAEYPVLASFMATFPDLVNVRLNVLGPRARLAVHEEHSIVRMSNGTIGACVRYHLPLVTNESAHLTLDEHVFHLDCGIVHLVNHGCFHAVRNDGAKRRVHLVWDQLLTRDAYDVLFGDGSSPCWGIRIADHERTPPVLRVERMGAAIRLPSPVGRDESTQIALL